MRAWLAPPSRIRPGAVAARQGVLLGVGVAVMLLLPVGLSVGLLVVVAAWVVGAWWWAVQLSEPVERTVVRQLSVSVGAGWGALLGLAYVGLGLQPGQLDLPVHVLAAAAVGIGGMGGLAAMGLTLCGCDAGRAIR